MPNLFTFYTLLMSTEFSPENSINLLYSVALGFTTVALRFWDLHNIPNQGCMHMDTYIQSAGCIQPTRTLPATNDKCH